jgi:hypothetical protein
VKKAPKAPLTIEDFIDRILIVCPRCSEMATVTSISPRTRARLVCTHCGLAKSREATSYTIGEVTDPYFHLPLWLQTSCSSHTVWAYNPDHLAFLKQYVEATDRRRPITIKGSGFNKSLAGRLPRWMQLARNREQVSKAIAAMESKLDAANAKLEQTK